MRKKNNKMESVACKSTYIEPNVNEKTKKKNNNNTGVFICKNFQTGLNIIVNVTKLDKVLIPSQKEFE